MQEEKWGTGHALKAGSKLWRMSSCTVTLTTSRASAYKTVSAWIACADRLKCRELERCHAEASEGWDLKTWGHDHIDHVQDSGHTREDGQCFTMMNADADLIIIPIFGRCLHSAPHKLKKCTLEELPGRVLALLVTVLCNPLFKENISVVHGRSEYHYQCLSTGIALCLIRLHYRGHFLGQIYGFIFLMCCGNCIGEFKVERWLLCKRLYSVTLSQVWFVVPFLSKSIRTSNV